MFDLSIIHRPGIQGGQQNLGRILETMLYYDRVHLMMSGQMFSGLWDILGADDLAALLAHPTVTTTLTPEMLAIHTDKGPVITTHRPIAMKMAGHDGKLIEDKDDVGSLLQALEGLPNRPGGSRAQVNKLLKMTKRSRYSKMLGGNADSTRRLVSLIQDPETLKLFIRGWAAANRKIVNYALVQIARIEVIELADGFTVVSNVALDRMVIDWVQNDGWGNILTSVQDYAVDLYLSNAHGADIVTAPEIAEVASARLDLSLQRAKRNGDQISAFEEMVFDEAHGFGDAINAGHLTFKEGLNVIDQSRRFRTWAKGLAPDADLIKEYHRAVTKDTVLKKLPATLARFSIFNGAGMLGDLVLPGAGLVSSAIDTFIIERLVGGWRPNIFVKNVQTALGKAEKRANARFAEVAH